MNNAKIVQRPMNGAVSVEWQSEETSFYRFFAPSRFHTTKTRNGLSSLAVKQNPENGIGRLGAGARTNM
jgi:hypothetical protein